MNARNRILWLFALFACLSSACLATSGTAPAPHSLGGTVVGLVGQLTLFANGTAVTVEQPGRFTFPKVFSEGTAYEVVVIDEPDDQECIVANGKGVMGPADVTNIGVTCAEKKGFRIGGKVNGLSGKLVLRNGTDTVTVMADGAFEFPVKVADGTPYAVGVEVEPLNQECTIAGSVGAVMGADVTNINVTCLVDDARLVDLVLSEGTLSPVFHVDTTIYLVNVSLLVPSLTLIPIAASADAIVLVNGKNVVSGMTSEPIELALGSNIVSVRVQAPSGAEREYAVIVDRQEKLPTTYVKASNLGTGDHFGYAVAISGDLFAVGAPDEDSSAQGINGDGSLNDRGNSGAVYVYVRQGDTWKLEAYIKPSNTDYNDNFGSSVALDGNTLVVGSPGEDSKANSIGGVQNDEGSANSGAAYVFVRDAMGSWSQQAYIKASNNDVNDAFGSAVAISGDTVAVGAPAEDSNAPGVGGDAGNDSAIDSGAVYVYFRTGTTWQLKAYVKSSNPDNGDKFGGSVALYEDTLAVGATDEDSNATGINQQPSEVAFESGATYVFVRDAMGMWSQQAFIKASNTGGDDRFGSSVALGKDRLIVGARTEDSASAGVNANQSDNGAYDAGAVYVFSRTGSTWVQESYIKASNPDPYDYFGAAVSIVGDMLAVGAFAEDASGNGLGASQDSNGESSAGAVYLFARGQNGWSQVGYLKALNSDAGDEFGRGVALSENTLVCGAQFEDSQFSGVGANPYNENGGDSGAVYVYH